jgi:hypothetical protein
MTLGNGRSNPEPSPNSHDDATPHTAPLLSGLPYQCMKSPSRFFFYFIPVSALDQPRL